MSLYAQRSFLLLITTFLLTLPACVSAIHAGTLQLTVRDKANKIVPFRIHLKDAHGEEVRHPDLPFHFDHFVSPGTLTYQLPAGDYTYEIERGPEFEQIAGAFELDEKITKTIDVVLKRITRMADRNWYSGDLHIHRPIEDVPLLIEAEDLQMGPTITWWNQRNLWKDKPVPNITIRQFTKQGSSWWYDVMAGEDERNGGALLYFHLKQPLDIVTASREHPSSLKYLQDAVSLAGVHVDIEKPFWWDVPAWVTTGHIDTIGLANNHMCRTRMYESEAWGFPRDDKKLPPPKGNGFWTQQLYYHLLNCGFRIPPSAGSASGVLPNPVGYNRVYVYVEGELTWGKWWEGLRAGRSFVTNGPLLEVTADNQLGGHVFQSAKSKTINIEGSIISRDPLETIEIIQNGEVVNQISPDGKTSVKFTNQLTFQESGWFLVRVRVQNERTFRFASTAPYYVEIGKQPQRISKKSVEFFQDWLDKRIEQIKKNVENEQELTEILPAFEQARKFWHTKQQEINAP